MCKQKVLVIMKYSDYENVYIRMHIAKYLEKLILFVRYALTIAS